MLSIAQSLLSRNLRRPVALGEAVQISDEGRRNRIFRVRDAGTGTSFIIKQVVADAYDPGNVAAADTRRFVNDWAGAAFVSSAAADGLSAHFYGGDYSRGFIILEDFGDRGSLVEPLLEQDAASAERALCALGRALGTLHAATAGRLASFEHLLGHIDPRLTACARVETLAPINTDEAFSHIGRMGISVDRHVRDEAAGIARAIENPGPFLSYVHNDPCPDNVSWDGQALRLFDFEFGGFGHALRDAAYPRMIFPSCWCANRVPAQVVLAFEDAYRRELVKGCPDAEDDRVFRAALTAACGYWLLNTFARSLKKTMEADSTWGIATVRQRVMARLEAFVSIAEPHDALPATCSLAHGLLDALRAAWPDTPPLPEYPAFRQPSRVV